MAMGMAEVVPGVSGGTIAFITGIYETLIDTIRSVTRLPFRVIQTEGLGAFWQKLNGTWLITLIGGMVLGIVVGVLGISYLLEHYPPVIWSFFFGLIVSSCIYMLRKIEAFSPAVIALLVMGSIAAYCITILTPAAANPNYLFTFLAGAVAICALILPGISGSFILLLLGMYTYVMSAVKDLLTEQDTSQLAMLFVFGLGCFTGLAVFSNVLSWTFKNYKNATLAVLTGFMIGSLNRIWPWRNVQLWLNEETGKQVKILAPNADPELYKKLVEENVWPGNYGDDPYLLLSVIAFCIGLGAVLALANKESDSEAAPET